MRMPLLCALMAGIAALTGPAGLGDAQIRGIPLWNKPSGPGGLLFSGDVGLGSSEHLGAGIHVRLRPPLTGS